MARDYEKKKAAMRAYYRTPAGRAAHKRAKERQQQKRSDGRIADTLKANPAPLINALANWR